MSNQHIVQVQVSTELVTLILTKGYKFPPDGVAFTDVQEGLPEGAKLIGAQVDLFSNTLNLLFEHETFEAVPDGQLIPYFKPILRHHTQP